MENLSRIFPFVWPYRRRLVASIGFALLVAGLWGAGLTTVAPIVEVLFEKGSLHGRVEREIASARADLERRTRRLKELPASDLQERARTQERLTEAQSNLARWTWANQHVMPWVPRDKFNTISLIFAILLGATILKGIFMYLQEVLIGSVVQLTIMGVRKECFRRCLRLDYLYLTQTGTSELMSRFTNDVEQLANGLRVMGVRVVREPLKACACISLAFVVNWRLTLLSMLVIPCIALVFHRFGRSMKKASRGTMESMALIYKSLSETFDRIKVVMAFSGERRHRQQFHRENKAYYSKAMRVIRIGAITSPTTEVLGVVAVFIALLPGAYLVLRERNTIWGIQLAATRMDLAQLSVLYALLAGTLDPIRKLSSVYSKIKRASAASDRIFAVMAEEPTVRDTDSPLVLGRHAENVSFDAVNFRYTKAGDTQDRGRALSDVSLTVSAGEVVAIVGENGCGKSTLVSLLPRYFDPESGAVRIDGIDIRDARLRDVRGQIGVVTQETLLFDDTIYENIRYGNPHASATQVQAAAKKAFVTPFLEQLPDGIQTPVGVNGSRLSGGQRQRIALARAILHDPSILILDEATSAVDAQSEQLIHRSLSEFVKGRTVFVITHALNSTFLDLATRIVVMDGGRIVGSGTHEPLMESCGVYQRLYRSQGGRKAG